MSSIDKGNHPDVTQDSVVKETQTKQATAKIDPMLLSALVCPKTRGPLIYDKEANELISKKAKLAFPIRQGVPIMLIEEARQL